MRASLGKELLDFVPGEGADELFLAADGGFDEASFAVLQLENLLLDSPAGDELVAGHDFGLPAGGRNKACQRRGRVPWA